MILGLKPLDLIVQELGITSFLRLMPISQWDGLGQNNKPLGHIRAWRNRGMDMGLSGKGYDRSGLRSFNWDTQCARVSNLKEEEINFICTI